MTFEIADRSENDAGVVYTMFRRSASGDPLGFRVESGARGVALRFGPTTAVSGWPAWLRGMSVFGQDGGRATIRLDPSHGAWDEQRSVRAFDVRNEQIRAALAPFAAGIGEALAVECGGSSPDDEQAFAVCTGLASAFAGTDAGGIVPAPALLPTLFAPSTLVVLVDDINNDTTRQHVRLTYRLPRIAGRWTDACSLRLFKGDDVVGVEFRALVGDRLPAPLRPACLQDDLGPLLRFSVDRAGNGVDFAGNKEAGTARRLAGAIVRQASRDLTPKDAPIPLAGFEAPHWRHWLAALPDLLAW